MTEEQSYALLEYVIHLIARDYPATLEDLIILGFISPEVGDDPEKVALVVPLLAKVRTLLLMFILQVADRVSHLFSITMATSRNFRNR